jgi:hypothetical protein
LREASVYRVTDPERLAMSPSMLQAPATLSTMNRPQTPVTGPIETISRGPRQRSLVAIGAAVVGTVLAVVGFYVGIIAALDGSGNGAGVWLVVMLVGLLLDLTALVLAVIVLARGGKRILPITTIAVALIPAIVFVMLLISVRA